MGIEEGREEGEVREIRRKVDECTREEENRKLRSRIRRK